MTGNAGSLTKRVVEFVRGSFTLDAIAISNVEYRVFKKWGEILKMIQVGLRSMYAGVWGLLWTIIIRSAACIIFVIFFERHSVVKLLQHTIEIPYMVKDMLH